MLVHHTFWGASTRADRTQRNAGRPRWFSHPTPVTLADMSYESSQLWAVDSVPLDLPSPTKTSWPRRRQRSAAPSRQSRTLQGNG